MISVDAAVLRAADQPYTIERLVVDEPGRDQIVVRIVAAGYCHSDLLPRAVEFPVDPPVITGHEGAGIVEWVGPDVVGVAVGDHVVLSFAHCGACSSCESGHPAYCDRFMDLNLFARSAQGGAGATDADGRPVMARWFGQSSFATKVVVDRPSVVVVDRDLPLETLAPLGCGMITGAGSVLNVLDVQPGTSIAVFGVGSVGLAALLAARHAGAETIIAVDLHPSRLKIAEEFGATATFLGDAPDIVEQIQAVSGGGTHYGFDTTGVPAVILSAVRSLRARGTCALVGVQTGDLVFDGAVLPGKQVISVVEGDADPQIFIPRLIGLWRAGEFPFDRLIEEYPLSAINDAEQASISGRTVKPVLIMPA